MKNLWDLDPNAQTQAALDEWTKRGEQEALAAKEWDAAWQKANAHAKEVAQQRKAAYEQSMKPPATTDENLAAIRKLLEAQAQGEQN